jgi:hypothetical protein
LPSSLDVRRSTSVGGVLLTLSANAVLANMQTDKAAFEGWALSLRLWCDEPIVILDWVVPETDSGHYQRFLYRVTQFRSLFPHWFDVADETKLAASRVLDANNKLVLNTASKARSITHDGVKAPRPEEKLELQLVSDPAFAARFGLRRLDRQFPVGLYNGRVSHEAAVFTGGKSAIDIVGVSDKAFWLFELKAGDNAPMGALTELLFYTSLIRDAAGASPKLRFADAPNAMVVRPDDVRHASAINAVLLTQATHPLLKHPVLVDALNAAAMSQWNALPGSVPVTFHAALVA